LQNIPSEKQSIKEAYQIVNKDLSIIFLVFSLLISGCGDLKITSYFDQPRVKLSKYEALEISDFESELPDVPEEILTKLPDEVARLLGSERIGLKKIERESIEDISAENTLVLLGEITEYESGKDIKFESGAIKFGESSLTVQLALVEKATGNEVVSGQVNGFSSLGFFRRGFIAKDVYKGLAEEIVKFISENY
jgi:hypothetical protein